MDKKKGQIERLRKRIDSLDDAIVELLNKRACCVIEVGKAKSKENREFYAPEREREIYGRLMERNKGPFPNKALKNVYREIMSASLSLEMPVRIAFLGPVATFTHQACIQHFGHSGEFLPQKDIAAVFQEVERGGADFGVVPIENSSEGVVSHTLDTLVTSPLKICAEVMIEITLALMNRSGRIDDVAKACSHPHALAQCAGWLKEKIPHVHVFDVSSTAMAAKLAAEDSSTAAVASPVAADYYDLRIIERNIEDNPHNYTRFLVIGKTQAKKTGSDKTSIMFAIKDKPGALYSMLKPFARRGINLTKIESRPLKTKAWEYVFFSDLDGHITDRKVKEAVEELEGACSFLKVLGSYPKYA